jgi:hypothetical protein
MFSHPLRVFAVAAGLLAAPALTAAQSAAPAEGAPVAGTAYVQSAQASRLFIDKRDIESMPELVDRLLDAITRLSNYQKPRTTPRVSRIPRAEIEHVVCRGPCAAKAYYLPEEGIFLDESLSPETNLVHRSILFHELVHFVQEANGEGESLDICNRWLLREQQAYELQNRYLARVGDANSYLLMVSNQSWVASNRNVCRAWERAAAARSAEARQVFGEGGEVAAPR